MTVGLCLLRGKQEGVSYVRAGARATVMSLMLIPLQGRTGKGFVHGTDEVLVCAVVSEASSRLASMPLRLMDDVFILTS